MSSKKILLLAMIPFLLITGCAKSKDSFSPDDKVIARINKYGLTVGDFKDGMKTTIAQKFLMTDPSNAKNDILEELIMRKILVQEAQKENFDKDRAFMLNIERYWEQALVKSLLKKKLEDISGMIRVTQKEIENEYSIMKSEVAADKQASFPSIEDLSAEIGDNIIKRKKAVIIEKWVESLRKRAKVKIDQGVLDEIEVK